MRLAGLLAAAVVTAACGDSTDQNELPPLSEGTVRGTVSGAGGTPLDSIRIELTVPSQLSLYGITGGGGLSDVEGRFSVPVSLVATPDSNAPPDTLAIYITATALPPRYSPPAGEVSVRDSVLVPVALAPGGQPPPVTEVDLMLPVAPASQDAVPAGNRR